VHLWYGTINIAIILILVATLFVIEMVIKILKVLIVTGSSNGNGIGNCNGNYMGSTNGKGDRSNCIHGNGSNNRV
jgi:hypothetical protein